MASPANQMMGALTLALNELHDSVQTEEDALKLISSSMRPREEHPVSSVWKLLGQYVPEPKWRINGWLPEGTRILVSGAPKARKSTLSLELAISMATGVPMLGHFPTNMKPASGLIVQEENSLGAFRRDLASIMTHRLGVDVAITAEQATERDAHGVPLVAWDSINPDVNEIGRLDFLVQQGVQLDTPEWLMYLRWAHEAVDGYDFLVLDPVYKLFPNFPDINQPASAAFILGVLDLIRTVVCPGTTLVVVHHATAKSREGGGSPASRILGSTYFPAWYDALIFPTRYESDNSLKVEFEFREMAPPDEPLYLASPEVGQWEIRDAPPAKLKKLSKLDELKDWLLLPGSTWLTDLREERVNRSAVARAFVESHPDTKLTPRTIRNYLSEIIAELDAESAGENV